MNGLTDKQSGILDYINHFSNTQGMAPTINELSEHFNVTPATIFAHVRALQRKGFLKRSSKARSISVANSPAVKPQRMHHFSMNLSIPVLGRISAGVPGEAEEHVDRYITIDPSLLTNHTANAPLFALTVQGESMRDAGILDGDLIIAEKTHSVKIGDIVIALLDDAVTVKYIFLSDGKWELRPANPEFQSRYVDLDKLQVQGIVTGLIRKF